MLMLSRVLLGLGGLLFLGLGAGFWFNTTETAATVGLTNVTGLGLATVRADVAGFFIVGGLLQALAAIRVNTNLIWPAQLLVLTAFLGRVITLVVDGSEAADIKSMAIELVLLAVMQWCRYLWTHQNR